MIIVNGQRITRQYIARLNDEDLYGLWNVAKDDIEYEAVIITYFIECEMEERKEKRMKEIMKALRQLEVGGAVTTKQITTGRIAVYINNEYFGIWDTNRKTFVD